MEQVAFLDKNNKIVIAKVDFNSQAVFYADMGHRKCSDCIALDIEPASEAQKNLLYCWMRYNLSAVTEKIKREIRDAFDAVKKEEAEKADAFSKVLNGCELWQFLHDSGRILDVEYFAQRIQAIFNVMGWSYHLIENVGIEAIDTHTLSIGDFKFYCHEPEGFEKYALQKLLDDEGCCLWKNDVDQGRTQLGFVEWCKQICRDFGWADVLNNSHQTGLEVNIDGANFWVGRA